jgi:SAM-dependent methyltransferase
MSSKPEQYLREEFNRWAEAGRGEHMEHDHVPIVRPMLACMNLQPDDRLLDVGCGTGWLERLVAPQLLEGEALGIDLSDGMIARARQASAGLTNVRFELGTADTIPAADGRFTQAVSVESAYYWPDPVRGLREIRRVLASHGSAWILINYYAENPYSHEWGSLLDVRTHLLAAKDWESLFAEAGFTGVEHRLIPDDSPTPKTYNGRWFRDAGELRRFKQIGALMVTASKIDESKRTGCSPKQRPRPLC